MANVSFVANHIPPPACYPPDFNALLDELTSGGGISGTVPDNSGGGIFVGSSPPSSSLTNKVWFKIDSAARPLGVYMFYNGNWRKVYTGATLGEIRMSWYYTGLFDGTGRGNIGGDLDGWALCNGGNGTPNLEAFTMVAGVPDFVGGGNRYITDLEGTWKNQGGVKWPVSISRILLPRLWAQIYSLPSAGGSGASQPVGPGAGPLLVDSPIIDAAGNQIDGAGQQPLPITPYQAIGFIMFVGYL